MSVVVPLYNEAENVDDLHRELTRSLEGMGRPYEILLVDDGSARRHAWRGWPRSRRATRACACCALRRNFGQTAAFSAGFDHARGRAWS